MTSTWNKSIITVEKIDERSYLAILPIPAPQSITRLGIKEVADLVRRYEERNLKEPAMSI